MESKERNALIKPFIWYHIDEPFTDYFVRCREASVFFGNDGELHKISDSYSDNRSFAAPPTSMTQIACGKSFYLYSVGLTYADRLGSFYPESLFLLPMELANLLEIAFPRNENPSSLVPHALQIPLTAYLKEKDKRRKTNAR